MSVLFLIIVGCSGYESDVPANSSVNEQEAGERLGIVLTAPLPGQIINTEDVIVEVKIRDFIVDGQAIGKTKALGTRHWHLYLDGEFLQASANPEIVLDRLSPGPHHVRVSLANNDHSALSPPAEDSVVVDVRGATQTSADNNPDSGY